MKNIQSFSLLPVLCFILSMCCSCEKVNPDTDDGIESLTFEYYGGSFKMVLCPGGTFLTNDDDDDLDFEDGPEVTVDPFWISQTEVTNELLEWTYNCAAGLEVIPGAIAGGQPIFDEEDINAPNYLCEDYVKWGNQQLIYMGGSQLYGFKDIELNGGFNVRSGLDDFPCTDITWYGTIMACNWITYHINAGVTYSKVYSGIDEDWWAYETEFNINKSGFRLPTSSEWECAARWQGKDNSGDCYEYPAGSGQYWTRGGCASGASATADDVTATSKVAVYIYDDASLQDPEDVKDVMGDREPNKLGLYDMSGNAWEWCYDEDEGWQSRIIRGGGARDHYPDVRISSSWDYPADGTASDLGFRLVMSADDK